MKIVVIGNVATGKTSLCVRWAHGTFTDHYKATVGVDFVVKGDCQLWDVAGQERFGAVTASFYRASHGALRCHCWALPCETPSAK
jgi:small GTP-binding protein